MQRESAEALALQALGWLATDEELFPVFLGSTGASLNDLKTGAGDPAFLGSVLDFVMMDDRWVLSFCQYASHPPELVNQARTLLPGGDVVHWT